MSEINRTNALLLQFEADGGGHTEGASRYRDIVAFCTGLKANYLEAKARAISQTKSNDVCLQVLFDADFDSLDELEIELMSEKEKLSQLEADGKVRRATASREKLNSLKQLQELYFEAVARAEAAAKAAAAAATEARTEANEAAAAAKECASKTDLETPNQMLAKHDFQDITELESELMSENKKLSKLEADGRGQSGRATTLREQVTSLTQLQKLYLEAVARAEAAAAAATLARNEAKAALAAASCATKESKVSVDNFSGRYVVCLVYELFRDLYLCCRAN
mgnify:CR=1 FL=1